MSRPPWLLDAELDAAAATRQRIARHVAALVDRHRPTAPRGSVVGQEQHAVHDVLTKLLADILVDDLESR